MYKIDIPAKSIRSNESSVRRNCSYISRRENDTINLAACTRRKVSIENLLVTNYPNRLPGQPNNIFEAYILHCIIVSKRGVQAFPRLEG